MSTRSETLYYFNKLFNPRPQQIQLCNWWDSVRDHAPKCKAADAPTGTGKSDFAMAVALREAACGRKVSIVTGSNLLLNQYITSFPDIPSLKGAEHYECQCFPGNTCGMTRQTERILGSRPGTNCGDVCPYLIARSECLHQNIAMFNTMSYFYFPKWKAPDSKGIPQPVTDLLIVDEFQMVAGMLNLQFELTLWEDDIKIPPGISASNIATVELLKKRLKALKKLIAEAQGKIQVKKVSLLLDHATKVASVAEMLIDEPDNFIIEEIEKFRRKEKLRCLQIRAVKPLPKVLKHFFAAKQVLLMSATALDIDIKELGFKKFAKIEVDSPIPVERRQVYAENIVAYSANTEATTLPLLINRIKEICSIHHPNERGIILVSYRLSKILEKHLTDKRFIFHEQQDKKDVIANFIAHGGTNTVAILCGSFEGLDLKGDLCRFVIIPVLPLANWGDAVVQKRIELDKISPVREYWYEMQAMKLVIQGSGRASRNETDKSTIYMLDTKFARCFATTKKQLPKTFIEAIKWGKR